MRIHWAKRLHSYINVQADSYGSLLVDAFHYLALFAIGATVTWAGIGTFFDMLEEGNATIDHILLLFIYLELGAMVGIYFKTKHMPVRFLIYVAITALTRMLIGSIQHDHTPNMGIIMISGAILLLSLATLVVRYGSYRFPSGSSDSIEQQKPRPNEGD
ncbi:phosphate-starvation-inducible protein PsiE [Azomonas macrocytogenes]|nr:phosphate-starvation-inducible PsiE family protein [Azomonas macrocytogenes]